VRPLRLTLENFLSYHGEHTVDLDGVTLAVLSGQNGAGKSSLVDAMRFALFGHTRGGLDGVVTEGEQHCRVEFAFGLGDETYLVSRSRSRKGNGSTLLSFQMLARQSPGDGGSNGDAPVVLDGKSVADTQARIEQTLRLTDDLFTVTACANQGNVAAFSQAKPAERKQVLSDILDLAGWERRAEMTRQIGRDLAARIEADEARHQALQGAAAATDGLREQIAGNDATQGDVARQVAGAEGDLAQAQEAKEALLRDCEADRARRKELDDLGVRAQRAQASVSEAASRLETLRRTLKDKPALMQGLRRAEEAHTYSQELEAKRQEDERVRHEAELLRQRQQAAVAEHARKVESLKERIAHLRATHQREVGNLEQRIGLLTKQSEVLDQVPCVRQDAKGLAEACPLIAQAREARAALPALESRLRQLRSEQPWAEDERGLKQLERQTPGSEEATRLREIAAQRAETAYDPKEHAEAKRQAGRLQELQQALRGVERAEAQMAEVQVNLEAIQAEGREVTARKAALEKELGPQRNWDAMLAQVERSIKETRAAISDLQARIQSLRQERGSLEERLRGAEQAAKDAEELAATLRESVRRLQVLKVLAQAFGKAGIPALLIEKAVPDLEAVANEVLSVLSDGRMSLELRSQRETKAKTLQETLDIIIADEHGARPYENFSGGEAMRVDLALRIALSVLLASRAGARCELLVLDEAAAPLDAQGRALFVDCLSKVADRFATILCITHVEELKDLFPFRFEVTKTAEGSRVNLVAA